MNALSFKFDRYEVDVSMFGAGKKEVSDPPASFKVDKELEEWVKFAIEADKDFDCSGALSGRDGYHSF
ncbi:hypothetical protein ACSEE7_20950 [Halomonas cupida]|uniref:hypothetical protein n=1 Tax=Halomonas cupida TaxID=44933 RepID=UPI003EF8EF78